MKNKFVNFLVLNPSKLGAYFGLALSGFGFILLLSNLGVIPNVFWSIFWPLLFIALGIYLLSRKLETKKTSKIKIKRRD